MKIIKNAQRNKSFGEKANNNNEKLQKKEKIIYQSYLLKVGIFSSSNFLRKTLNRKIKEVRENKN